ncbi:sensor domain-containing diguanylate cyclase [Desulfovibrio gilichinskyi]|uniref:diguanylate cyclase n=1 Tax=Desulfovibrio gilichinskyi TaxID=1519643 RepID=A0A1X7CZK1_9BACT|nr:sensor domain-containing diguanylate cyclase [Desulfovibrio gilichinskyi]SMF05979.1 diguanylate cyclase (GGDEF) domain-containing protein [Desulfovibrio gilichinskyi]
MSVRFKLITTLTAILVVSFISVSIFNYNVSRNSARNEILNSALPLTRDNIYSELQSGLMRPLFVSSLMANDIFLKDWANAGEKNVMQLMRYLYEIKNKYGFFTAFFVSATTGDYFYYDGVLKTVSPKDSHDVWYYDFINSGKEYDFDVDTNEAANNVLTVFINHRVNDKDGKLIGVTGVGLKMDQVANLLKTFAVKYSKEIFLIDPQGFIQVHPDKKLIGNINIKNIPGFKNIADDVLAMNRTSSSMFKYKVDGESVHLTARFIPEFNWFLIVEQKENAAMMAARNNFIRTLGSGALVTLLIIILSIITINHFQSRLEAQANTDPLTGVANRRSFEKRIDAAMNSQLKTGRPFSLVLMDLDGFKVINDTCGHNEGDRLLKEISKVINSSIRENDFCARWGGDEFIVLVSGDLAQATLIAERIRNSIERTIVCEDVAQAISFEMQVTVSCGITQYLTGDTLDSLTSRADKAMYESKELGKNKVVVS